MSVIPFLPFRVKSTENGRKKLYVLQEKNLKNSLIVLFFFSFFFKLNLVAIQSKIKRS